VLSISRVTGADRALGHVDEILQSGDEIEWLKAGSWALVVLAVEPTRWSWTFM